MPHLKISPLYISDLQREESMMGIFVHEFNFTCLTHECSILFYGKEDQFSHLKPSITPTCWKLFD